MVVSSAERILTVRELNRTTLARQMLLGRARLSALEAIKQFAGLQSQPQPALYRTVEPPPCVPA